MLAIAHTTMCGIGVTPSTFSKALVNKSPTTTMYKTQIIVHSVIIHVLMIIPANRSPQTTAAISA